MIIVITIFVNSILYWYNIDMVSAIVNFLNLILTCVTND